MQKKVGPNNSILSTGGPRCRSIALFRWKKKKTKKKKNAGAELGGVQHHAGGKGHAGRRAGSAAAKPRRYSRGGLYF